VREPHRDTEATRKKKAKKERKGEDGEEGGEPETNSKSLNGVKRRIPEAVEVDRDQKTKKGKKEKKPLR